MLEAIEKKVAHEKDAKLKDEFITKKAIFAFKEFYDEDVIDEETILSWYLPEGASEKKLDPLRKALQPFCKWLEYVSSASVYLSFGPGINSLPLIGRLKKSPMRTMKMMKKKLLVKKRKTRLIRNRHLPTAQLWRSLMMKLMPCKNQTKSQQKGSTEKQKTKTKQTN